MLFQMAILLLNLCSQMPEVSPEQADTYKCFATNEYGKAVVTANLNVIESEDTITPGLIYGAKPGYIS